MFDPPIPKAKIYLTRRNLLTLLSKLDRELAGDDTMCAIIKHRQETPEYQQTMDAVMIIAVDDNAYYDSLNRLPGVIHHQDELNIQQEKYHESITHNLRQDTSSTLSGA